MKTKEGTSIRVSIWHMCNINWLGLIYKWAPKSRLRLGGRGQRAHLQLQVGVRQLLGLLLQRRHPQLPLLPAARGRRSVPLQELLPALVGIVLRRPAAPPAGPAPCPSPTSSCAGAAAPARDRRRHGRQLREEKNASVSSRCEFEGTGNFNLVKAQ